MTSRERNPQFCGTPARFRDRGFYSIQAEELTCPESEIDLDGPVGVVDSLLPKSKLTSPSPTSTSTKLTTSPVQTTIEVTSPSTTSLSTTVSSTTQLSTTTASTTKLSTVSTTTAGPTSSSTTLLPVILSILFN